MQAVKVYYILIARYEYILTTVMDEKWWSKGTMHSSPPLIKTLLLSNNSVHIKHVLNMLKTELFFGEKEHHMHSGYLLPRTCVFSRGMSSLESVLFERGATVYNFCYNVYVCYIQDIWLYYRGSDKMVHKYRIAKTAVNMVSTMWQQGIYMYVHLYT